MERNEEGLFRRTKLSKNVVAVPEEERDPVLALQ
jgi:hypothetical protein